MVATVTVGTVIAGRYALKRRIDAAGIGSLWQAADLRSGQSRAVRIGDVTGKDPAQLAARYRAEAETIAQIRCKHVVDVLDHGEWQTIPYLVLELVEGEDLGARLRREGSLEPGETYLVVAQVASALARAHAAGIAHGDLKPDHILLATVEGKVTAKLFDFGLSQRSTELGIDQATQVGSFMGMPSYASPEQLSKKPTDWRVDLWSLSVIAFECLTGRRPFDSNSYGDLIAQILYEPIAPLQLPSAETPPALAQWWEQASARDPAERFQSARDLADLLGNALELPIIAVPSLAPKPISNLPKSPSSTAPSSRSVRQSTRLGLGEGSPAPAPAAVPRQSTRLGLGESVPPKPAEGPLPPAEPYRPSASPGELPAGQADDNETEQYVAHLDRRRHKLRVGVSVFLALLVTAVALSLLTRETPGPANAATSSDDGKMLSSGSLTALGIGDATFADGQSDAQPPSADAGSDAGADADACDSGDCEQAPDAGDAGENCDGGCADAAPAARLSRSARASTKVKTTARRRVRRPRAVRNKPASTSAGQPPTPAETKPAAASNLQVPDYGI